MATKEATKEVAEQPKKSTTKTFTYVGGGEDSPRVIEFMGRQRFVRGKETEVTDPVVLGKLVGGSHPTFIEGGVDEEELHDYDEKAKKEADTQRKKDQETQSIAARLASRWGSSGE